MRIVALFDGLLVDGLLVLWAEVGLVDDGLLCGFLCACSVRVRCFWSVVARAGVIVVKSWVWDGSAVAV